MKLYTSGQVVRVVFLSVAGTAILATTIFFCNKEKILKSNNTQSEYNNEVTVSEEKNDFLLEKDEISSGVAVASTSGYSQDEQQNIYVYSRE